MKLPLSYLKTYLGVQKDADEVADSLTLLGLEVEKILNKEPSFLHVVCGEILSVKPEKGLLLLEMTDGKKNYSIVCGDPTCKKGERVAFAPPGAKLFSEGSVKTIEKAEIRGIHSSGMLCSGFELGISEDKEQVYRLDETIPVGTDLVSILWDPVLDISLTPNLGHCQSVLGIARELAAFWKIPLQIPVYPVKEEISLPAHLVSIKAAECPRYAYRVMHGVKVGPSPIWLKRKVELLGLRSINNIVDCTNLIMMEYGQPLHAFDLGKIEGKVEVELSSEEISFHFLDEITRTVPKGSLFIKDQKKPLVLAGIMGGLNSGVTEETKEILIESAFFDPALIRKTAKRLGVRSDSSQRFEKGVDPNGTLFALDAAAVLMQKVAGGKISKASNLQTKEFLPKKIRCRIKRVESILGQKISLSEAEGIFKRLGFDCKIENQEILVSVPAFRFDLNAEIDLIEEIARIYGYNHFELTPPYFTHSSVPNHPFFHFEQKIRETLVSQNLTEILTADLISPSLASLVQDSGQIEVLHSKSEEHKFLRTSLLPGVLQVLKYNLSHKNNEVRGFELGRIHFKKDEKYLEQNMAAIVLMGKEIPPHFDNGKEVDFFSLKGVVENLLLSLSLLDKAKFTSSSHPSFHPFRQASLWIEGQEIGVLGEIHPALLDKCDIKTKVFYSECNLFTLLKLAPTSHKLVALPIYPGSERDLTITLPDELPIALILEKISALHSTLLEKVELTSLYKSDKIGIGKKNATFRFVYRRLDKTLTFEEAEKEHNRICESILNNLP
ncbi:MAG TPA: phenylalanine--tRNA ligase subunit beta [Chlamydiales bacterium]|nr:phenylalanine--tRNA ligase subunit beta [Chlamydiales bacterium]